MTIIAWDGEVLATDTQGVHGNAKFNSTKAWYESVKGQACIISGVGTLRNIHRHKEWLLDGCNDGVSFPYTELDNHYYQLILVNKEGLLRYEGTPYPIEYGVNVCAFGDGCDFAYGALSMGASAVEAVRVAINCSPKCGGNIESFSLVKGEHNETKQV